MAAPNYPHKTLVFLRDPTRRAVLLAMKKRGFGVGKWNGVGGKVEGGETIEEAAVRETREEIGVEVAIGELTKYAELTFAFRQNAAWNCVVHVYMATSWIGTPAESEEMRPAWHSEDGLPFDEMWEDDRHWLPRALAGEFVCTAFTFGIEGALTATHGLDPSFEKESRLG